MADPFCDSSAFDEFERERTPILNSLATEEEEEEDDEESAKGDQVEFIVGSPSKRSSETPTEGEHESAPPDSISDSGESDSGSGESDTDSEKSGTPRTSELKRGDLNGALNGGHTVQNNNKALKHELSQLKYENSKMLRCYKMLDPSKYVTENEGPALQVVFMNDGVSRKYRAEIERYIASLLQRENQNRDRDKMPPLQIRPNAIPLGDEADPSDTCEQIQQFNTRTAIGCCQFYREFTVDSLGWPLVAYNPSLTDGWEIPKYTQFFMEALPVDEDDTPKPQKRPRPKMMCFNCGGEHNLSECREPRDHRKIAENRMQFNLERSKSSQSLAKNARYIEDPRFAKFKPGVISEDLRKALGINPHQLPPYIYQMRLLGYPPGHLDAAKVQTSGLSLFGKDGKEIGLDDEILEDGEVDMDKIPKVQYNFDKLVDFPGYNVDPPEGTVDDSMKYNAPPMMPQHSKAVLQLYLTPQSSKTSSKRQHSDIGKSDRKRKKQRKGSGDEPSIDMEIESADEGQLSQDSTVGSIASSKQTSREGSPDLDDLEEKKRKLQLQLQMAAGEDTQDSENSLEPSTLDSCGEEVLSQDSEAEGSFIPPLPPTPVRPPLPDNTPPNTPPLSRRGSQSSFIPGVPSPLVNNKEDSSSNFKPPLPPDTPPTAPPTTPSAATPASTKSGTQSTPVTPQGANISQLLKTPSTGGSVSMTFGTPVSGGSAAKDKGLPDASKFASNIEEDIPFENLPNATGTFQKMKKVLDFIRSRKSSS